MDILIENNFEGMLIREVLRSELGYSANLIKKLKFSPDGIKVNGKWVTVRYVLQNGDILSLDIEDKPEDVSSYIIPVNLPIEVIYEDSYVTAVNKPYNMPSHPSLGHKNDTVANALAYRYSDKTYVFRPVNRLDRDTSGCMLTSNMKDASYKMYRAMTEGRIKKMYVAIIDGIFVEKEGTIRSFMHRKENSVIEREETAENTPDAKPAVTKYKVLCEKDGYSAVLASPITGRTHQIRVQFAGGGCAVTGDTLYGKKSEMIDRHALHSYITVFPHPKDGKKKVAEAPIPQDIVSLAGKIGFYDEMRAALDQIKKDIYEAIEM